MRKIAAGSLLGPLALVAATVLVVLLALQTRALRAQLATERQKAVLVQVGSYLPAFQAQTLDGNEVVIGGADGDGQVLFLYNTSSPFCLRNVPAWKQIAGTLTEESGIGVYGIAVDSAEATRSYAAAHRLTYASILLQRRNLISMYRARVVPQTLVVDTDGLVVHSRAGVLDTRAAIDSVLTAAGRLRGSSSAVAHDIPLVIVRQPPEVR